ncbi:DUF6702 family protein [Pustulibacterium marinum]|nr:DUF6702 family protein [Pustulibacterium marinum]
MKFIKTFILLISFVSLSAFTMHKFYVSTTQVNYSEKDKSLQITSRLFIDDFQQTLNDRYAIDSKLATEKELKNIDLYIEKYFIQKLKISINGNKTQFNYIGHEYEDDVIKVYTEIPEIDKSNLQSIQIENILLMDEFSDQQNIIHFKIGDFRRSFNLINGNDKAMLKI